MKARYALTTAVLLFACLGAQPRDDGAYSLNWKPKEGQALTYELSTEMSAEGDKTIVLVKVAGTFPGSPANLTYRFGFSAEGRIGALEVR